MGERLDEIHPADAFDELVGARAPIVGYAERLEIIAAPGAPLPDALDPEDILLVRALGEGRLGRLVPLGPEASDDGRRASLGGPDGRLLADRMIVRPRLRAELESVLVPCAGCGHAPEGHEVFGEADPHRCRRGEGPPAAETDPDGNASHPTIKYGTTRRFSRRPTVGYAQQRLNVFLERYQSGIFACKDDSAATRRYVDARLAELRAASQLPLVVDCRFGSKTRAATRAFQACMGLTRNGVIAADTWELLDQVDQLTVFRMRVDADRDGVLDEGRAPTSWTWGPFGSGAVVLVNNDDDGGNRRPDNEDDRVDGGLDHSELSILAVEQVGTRAPPAGTRLELVVAPANAIRVFGGVTPGSTEVAGASAGGTHRFPALPSGTPSLLGMEGVRYAGRGFDGLVTITLRIVPPRGSTAEVRTVVRMAPWRMSSHLERAERVYVYGDRTNARFRRDLGVRVRAAGCTLVEHVPRPAHGDVWMQDCMEFGSANIPTKGYQTVMRAPRTGDLSTFPRTLLTNDLGYVEIGTTAGSNTLDSSGNLEVSPPVTVRGKRYPFGRIYFCGRRRATEIDTRPPPSVTTSIEALDVDLRAFLDRQVIQAPFSIDTGWLAVSHADEAVSFVPAPGDKRFKMLIASPRRAYQILDGVVRRNPTARMLTGRQFRPSHGRPSPFPVEQTVRDFLRLRDDFHPELRHWMAALPGVHTARPLRDYNTDRQTNLDAIRTTMMTELGLVADDIIDVPVIFMPTPDMPVHADAMIPNMVNMLVLNGHCIVPDPFGPIVGGRDLFQRDLQRRLQSLGLTVSFVDCWDDYHIWQGEIHCGTNTLRTHCNVKWWEYVP